MQFHGLPWHQKNLDDNARKEERAISTMDKRHRETTQVPNFRLIRLRKYDCILKIILEYNLIN